MQTQKGTIVPKHAHVTSNPASLPQRVVNKPVTLPFVITNMNARQSGEVASFIVVSQDAGEAVFNAAATATLSALRKAQIEADLPVAAKMQDALGASGKMTALLTANYVQSAEVDGTPMVVDTEAGPAHVWGEQYHLTPLSITLEAAPATSIADLKLANSRSDGILTLDGRRDVARFGGRAASGATEIKYEVIDL